MAISKTRPFRLIPGGQRRSRLVLPQANKKPTQSVEGVCGPPPLLDLACQPQALVEVRLRLVQVTEKPPRRPEVQERSNRAGQIPQLAVLCHALGE